MGHSPWQTLSRGSQRKKHLDLPLLSCSHAYPCSIFISAPCTCACPGLSPSPPPSLAQSSSQPVLSTPPLSSPPSPSQADPAYFTHPGCGVPPPLSRCKASVRTSLSFPDPGLEHSSFPNYWVLSPPPVRILSGPPDPHSRRKATDQSGGLGEVHPAMRMGGQIGRAHV